MPSTTKISALFKLQSHTESACNLKKMKLHVLHLNFFRLIGPTWRKVQHGLTQRLKSSSLTAWVQERFQLWGRTTNLITIVSGILHRGERIRGNNNLRGLNLPFCAPSRKLTIPNIIDTILYFRVQQWPIGEILLT